MLQGVERFQLLVLPGRYTHGGILKAMVRMGVMSMGVRNCLGSSGDQHEGVRGLNGGRLAAFPPSAHGGILAF